MRGLLFPGDRTVRLDTFPDPTPGPGEVLVRIHASAVCGSDIHGYRQPAAERAASGADRIIPGHEPAGVVEALGQGVSNVKVGDRVAVYHYRGCGHCQHCRGGRLMWCDDRQGYGGPIHGPDAELLITDALNCLPLPDDASFSLGAILMCAGSTAYNAVTKLDARPGQTVAVFGLGPVGLSGLLFAQAKGADVIGIDLSPQRLELAERLGAKTLVDGASQDITAAIRSWAGRDGVAASFETSGSAAAQAATVEVAGLGGRIVFVGFGATTPSIMPASFIGKQLHLMGSFVFPIDLYEDALGFVQRYDVPLEGMVTHTVSLDESLEIFPAFDRGETGKVIIDPTM